jgi:beta-glucanase (GH16 family)
MDSDVVAAPPRRARLARVLVVAVVLALLPIGWLTTRTGANAAVPPPPTGLALVFSDDFEGAAGSSINTNNWIFDLGHNYPGGAANWGTGEVEEATNSTDNVFLDGAGHLAIRPVRDAAGTFTSGRIETKRTDFAAPAGGKLRIEGSLQQPNVSGAEADGYWPAFWTMGEGARPVGATNWPGIGEWDVMEAINGRESVFQTLHCGVAPGGACNEFSGLGSGEQPCPGCKAGFHTFAVEYDSGASPETLKWFVDGRNTFTLSESQVEQAAWTNATDRGLFIILNVAMGGSFPGAFGAGLPSASTRSGVPMLVDYVAVYATAGQPAS